MATTARHTVSGFLDSLRGNFAFRQLAFEAFQAVLGHKEFRSKLWEIGAQAEPISFFNGSSFLTKLFEPLLQPHLSSLLS